MKFDKRNVALASLVFGWISIFWNVYDQLIQSINTYSFALEPYESGWILAIDNIVGLFILPLFGHFSDRCKSRFGKRTPYIYVGTAISLIGLCLVGVFASEKATRPVYRVTDGDACRDGGVQKRGAFSRARFRIQSPTEAGQTRLRILCPSRSPPLVSCWRWRSCPLKPRKTRNFCRFVLRLSAAVL